MDVECKECGAERFHLCVYVENNFNIRKRLVGKPIIRNGRYWFHNSRKAEFHNWWFKHVGSREAERRLIEWLSQFADIFEERK